MRNLPSPKPFSPAAPELPPGGWLVVTETALELAEPYIHTMLTADRRVLAYERLLHDVGLAEDERAKDRVIRASRGRELKLRGWQGFVVECEDLPTEDVWHTAGAGKSLTGLAVAYTELARAEPIVRQAKWKQVQFPDDFPDDGSCPTQRTASIARTWLQGATPTGTTSHDRRTPRGRLRASQREYSRRVRAFLGQVRHDSRLDPRQALRLVQFLAALLHTALTALRTCRNRLDGTRCRSRALARTPLIGSATLNAPPRANSPRLVTMTVGIATPA